MFSRRPIVTFSSLCVAVATASLHAATAGVGERVDAVDFNGKWVGATVVKVDGERRFVHYDDKSDYWDAWVNADQWRALGAADKVAVNLAGERVEAFGFSQRWADATVVKVDGPRRFVHYDGKSAVWDEWLTPERVRPIGTGNALALQRPAPEQPGAKGLGGWIVGTRAERGMYACTFYGLWPDGHVFVGDRMPDEWATASFAELQKADAVHCGTYGVDGARMSVQMNGDAAAHAIAFGPEVIGDGIRRPAWSLRPGQRLEAGFSVDAAGASGGVSTVASDSWSFRADGTFKRVRVAGAMTDDAKAARDPHPAKALADGSDVVEGRYDFAADGRLLVTPADGKTQTLGCFAVGPAQGPSLIGIAGVIYKANVDQSPVH